MCNDFLIKVSSFFVLIIIFPTFLSGIEFKHSQPSRFSYDDIKASKQSDKFSIRKPSQNSQEDPRPDHRNQSNQVNSTISLGDKYSTHETQVNRRQSRKLETFRGQTDPRQSSIRIEKNKVETEENSDMSGSNPGYSTPINSNLNSASGVFKHSQPSRFSYDDIKASKQSDKFSIRRPSQNSQEDPRPGHRNQTNKVNSTINLGDKYSTHETQVSRRPSRKLETFRGQTDPRQSSIRIEKNTVETEENSDMSGSNPGYSTPINSNLNSASGECTHNSRIFSKSCSCKK